MFIDFDLAGHKILFEDKKLKDQEQQIKFNGVPFMIIGHQLLDCTHGVDHHKARKKSKEVGKKSSKKVKYIIHTQIVK